METSTQMEPEKSYLLCSDCFSDMGLMAGAKYVGDKVTGACINCKSEDGAKLSKEKIQELSYEFFVRGSVYRSEYGGCPRVQFNDKRKNSIKVPIWLQHDIQLISEATGNGFFYYGPRLWMIGHVVPLEALQNVLTRGSIIESILTKYPKKILTPQDMFLRLRVNPSDTANIDQYDSPPLEFCGTNRLDSVKCPIMYGSQDIQVCVHECRVTTEDMLFAATVCPVENLKLLDLSVLIELDEHTTEFESLDMAIHMLFLAGKHAYEICREIAVAALQKGFDGIIYPSYFSLVRTGAMPFETVFGISIRVLPPLKQKAQDQVIENIALFGHPIKEGKVSVKGINRVLLNQAYYNITYGPVLLQRDSGL